MCMIQRKPEPYGCACAAHLETENIAHGIHLSLVTSACMRHLCADGMLCGMECLCGAKRMSMSCPYKRACSCILHARLYVAVPPPTHHVISVSHLESTHPSESTQTRYRHTHKAHIHIQARTQHTKHTQSTRAAAQHRTAQLTDTHMHSTYHANTHTSHHAHTYAIKKIYTHAHMHTCTCHPSGLARSLHPRLTRVDRMCHHMLLCGGDVW